jgi:hypothetical protein
MIMAGIPVQASIKRSGKVILLCLTVFFITGLLLSGEANATENGASVYPLGVDTVLGGMMPPPKETKLFVFNSFYSANEKDNSAGQSLPTEFKVRVFANALRVSHNWGVPVLGGRLESLFAIPVVYEQLHIAPGKYDKIGISNVDLTPFVVGYNQGNWHWFYRCDFILPGASYAKSDALNIGQHNFALGPVGAFTYLSNKAHWEASSKVTYLVNFHGAANYRSGNELIWEYAAMRAISRKASLGVNGYLYQQVTDDKKNKTVWEGGYRGRDLSIGPAARVSLGKQSGFTVKYTRDTLVENRSRGGTLWFQIGFPLSFGKKE